MEPLVGVVLILVAVGGLGWVSRWAERNLQQSREEFYRALGSALGLHPTNAPRRGANVPVLEGTIDGFPVTVVQGLQDKRAVLRVSVTDGDDAAASIPFGLRLRREEGLGFLESVLSEDHTVGDDDFDAAVRVGGEPPRFMALLDARTREAVLTALTGGNPPQVQEGVVVKEEPLAGLEAPAFEAHVRELVRLAKLLMLRESWIPRRLAANAAADPVVEVRRRCLKLLADQFPDAPETGPALRAALDDEAAVIALQAALALEGAADFERIKRLVLEPEVQQVAGKIPLFSLVEERYPREQVLGFVHEVLLRPVGPLHAAALRFLGRKGSAADEPRVLELLDALDTAPEEVRLAAAGALGDIGTVAAVGPLRAVAGRFPLHFDLRRAAGEAIAKIQSRLPGAGAGQVALHAGADATGQVSLADPPAAGRGRLALGQNEPPGQR